MLERSDSDELNSYCNRIISAIYTRDICTIGEGQLGGNAAAASSGYLKIRSEILIVLDISAV